MEFVEKYLELVANKGFKRVEYEDVFCYELWKVLGISKNMMIKLFDEYNLSEYFKNIDFINGAKEGVCVLNLMVSPSFSESDSREIEKAYYLKI